MSKLTEKIKNIFRSGRKSEMAEPKKDKSLSDTMMGANDIARSIRESKKLQTQKKLWRNVFHF